MKRGWYRIITPWEAVNVYGRAKAEKAFEYYRQHTPASMEDWNGNLIRVATRGAR